MDAASDTEKRVYFEGHHYLSVLTEGGIFAIRPHPGEDVDGWGSTLYLQPFFSGATLGHTVSVIVNAGTNGVEISASGEVSKGVADTYGTWG